MFSVLTLKIPLVVLSRMALLLW